MANQTHQVPAGTQAKVELATKADMDNLVKHVLDLSAKIDELLESSKNSGGRTMQNSEREMTDDDARTIMSGELKDAKHSEAARKLGLSYGQVYSARLGYTFKQIHKEMADNKIPNPWIKKT